MLGETKKWNPGVYATSLVFFYTSLRWTCTLTLRSPATWCSRDWTGTPPRSWRWTSLGLREPSSARRLFTRTDPATIRVNASSSTPSNSSLYYIICMWVALLYGCITVQWHSVTAGFVNSWKTWKSPGYLQAWKRPGRSRKNPPVMEICDIHMFIYAEF